VHRPHRTEITAFVEKRREHFGRRQVDESRLVQRIEQRLALDVVETPWRRWSPPFRAVTMSAGEASRRDRDCFRPEVGRHGFMGGVPDFLSPNPLSGL
jgi:hypothetical protein